MCNKAADYSLVELKLSADWFVISKMIKKLLRLLTQMKIYSIFMTIPVMLDLLVMEWVILVKILIILTLTILIMIKMILILLFLSDFWPGIVNLKNATHLKKDKLIINANEELQKCVSLICNMEVLKNFKAENCA